MDSQVTLEPKVVVNSQPVHDIIDELVEFNRGGIVVLEGPQEYPSLA